MDRPLGVTLVAVLTSLWGIFAVAGAFEGFVGTGLVLRSGPNRRDAAEMLLAAVISSFVAVLLIRVTWGLLNLRKWARTLTILIAAMGLAFGSVSLVAEVLAANWKYSGPVALSICLNLASLLYLLKGRVKHSFTAAIKS